MKEKIRELIKLLNEASKAYEQGTGELMSNREYDELYDRLTQLEKDTGIIFADSPTRNVGYEVLSDLPKEAHPKRMLSLDKTKDVEQLRAFLGEQRGILSWKIDGLTIVLTYENGELSKAVTRGNGEIGEVVTSNAKTFKNLPVEIPFKGRLVLRGEAFITYSSFEKINHMIEDVESKYKNPRNLCSGSVRQLNSEITARRGGCFNAFALVEAEGVDFRNSREAQLDWLDETGFDTVQRKTVDAGSIEEAVGWFADNIADYDIPSDGLVLIYDDIEYGRSLGETAKFPRDSIAFKWKDETAVTRLKEMEWSPSRTGLINPVAIFEPVQLEGTTVSRASVHNLSIMKQLQLGEGDEIEVYKANMIIPQILENHTRSASVSIPEICPVCGAHTEIRDDTGVETLVCPNPKCQVKHIKAFTHFVSRDAMNIDGMSEATVEKFVDAGFIKKYGDFFRLDRFENEISSMEGFGEKSFNNIVNAAKEASHTTAARLLYALGIANIGAANAKVIARACGGDWERMKALDFEQLVEIQGIGDVMAADYTSYFKSADNLEIIADLEQVVSFEQEQQADIPQSLEGKTFVITGSLNHFENRQQLKEFIENRGGKVAGSVSSKTDYLINNDNTSGSSKNKKAKELNIPIITEEEFLEMINNA